MRAPCFLRVAACKMPLVSGPEDKPQGGGDVAARLQAAMDAAGYSQRRLAAAMQLRHPRKDDQGDGAESWRNTIRRYVKGKQVPSPETAKQLAEILGADEETLTTPPRGGTQLWRENAELRRQVRELQAELGRHRARFAP